MHAPQFVRAHRYRVAPEINLGKADALNEVYGEWARTLRALEQWSARLRATLAQATPGSMRHQRAVGRARAGLTRLMKEKRPASLQASESSAWSGLLEELRCALPKGTGAPSVGDSTRCSG